MSDDLIQRLLDALHDRVNSEVAVARDLATNSVADGCLVATAERALVGALAGVREHLERRGKDLERLLLEVRTLRSERNAAALAFSTGVWVWSDTDPNDLDGLCEEALVTMTAGQLRGLLAKAHQVSADNEGGAR